MENIAKYIKWKNSQINNCKEKNFAYLFEIIHDQEDRIFCEYVDGLKNVSVTYTEFKDYCLKMATYLKQQLKSPEDSFVGIYMENSINWIAAFWGLLMIGYKPLLLNCKLPNNMNKEIVGLMKCKEIVTNNEFANNDLGLSTIVINQANVKSSNKLEDTHWADEIALCTTASSLNYKVCVYGGENIFYQLANAIEVLKSYCPWVKEHYEGRLKQLLFLPLYHIFGLFATYFWFVLYGRTMVFLKDYSADTIINTIKEFKVTHIFSVPLFWNTIAKEVYRQVNSLDDKTKKKFNKGQKIGLKLQNICPKCGRNITRKLFKEIVNKTLGPSVLVMISGGGYISDSTLNLFNAIGYPLLNGYGTSEIGIICFENRAKPKYRLLGCVGKPLKSVEVKIEHNTLWVRGKSTCKYYVTKDGTRFELNGNWFNTNDNVAMDDNGYITCLGRQDDVIINQNGEKINPDLIEKLLVLPNVINFVVVERDHKTCLIVQLREKINSLDLPNVINEIHSNVDKVAKQGYTIDAIYYTNDMLAPKNAIKVSRKILHEQLDAGQIHLFPLSNLKPIENISEEEINNEFISEIRKIFGDVLNKDPQSIGINQHLILDLCASSLDYFTIMTRLENEYNIKFNFKEKSCQTIKSFADYIIKLKKGVK